MEEMKQGRSCIGITQTTYQTIRDPNCLRSLTHDIIFSVFQAKTFSLLLTCILGLSGPFRAAVYGIPPVGLESRELLTEVVEIVKDADLCRLLDDGGGETYRDDNDPL